MLRTGRRHGRKLATAARGCQAEAARDLAGRAAVHRVRRADRKQPAGPLSRGRLHVQDDAEPRVSGRGVEAPAAARRDPAAIAVALVTELGAALDDTLVF